MLVNKDNWKDAKKSLAELVNEDGWKVLVSDLKNTLELLDQDIKDESIKPETREILVIKYNAINNLINYPEIKIQEIEDIFMTNKKKKDLDVYE